jgi:drug/metabolite transporter (DMT)-like permease
MNNETKGILFGLIGVSAFGLTLPVTRAITPYMDPIFIGLGRAVIAAIVALLLLLWCRQKIPNATQIKRLIIVALGVVIGFPVFSSWAMQYVHASHGGVVLGILPLATAIAGICVGDEKPSVLFWLVSVFGSTLVIVYALLQGSGSLHIADLALLGAVIAAAIGYAVGSQLSKELGDWQVICWALVLSLPFILIPTILHMPTSFSSIPFNAYACFLYLALVSQLFAFFFWYKGLALGGIARVSQVQLFQPFMTILASILLFGETMTIETLIFAFLVVSFVWVGKKMPIAKKHLSPP